MALYSHDMCSFLLAMTSVHTTTWTIDKSLLLQGSLALEIDICVAAGQLTYGMYVVAPTAHLYWTWHLFGEEDWARSDENTYT